LTCNILALPANYACLHIKQLHATEMELTSIGKDSKHQPSTVKNDDAGA